MAYSFLFVTNGFNWIELGRLHGRIDSKQQSDQDRHAEGDADGRAVTTVA